MKEEENKTAEDVLAVYSVIGYQKGTGKKFVSALVESVIKAMQEYDTLQSRKAFEAGRKITVPSNFESADFKFSYPTFEDYINCIK